MALEGSLGRRRRVLASSDQGRVRLGPDSPRRYYRVYSGIVGDGKDWRRSSCLMAQQAAPSRLIPVH